MSDQYTPTPVRTKTNGDVVAKIVDVAGTNVAGVDASNNVKTVVNNASGASAVNIQDGGNSITVDATSLPLPTGAATEATLASIDSKITACNTGAVTVASSALPTGAATEATLASIDGNITTCDTGNVTLVNGAGAAAVNIQDGGNSITVDGTVTVTPSGTQDVNLTQIAGTATDVNNGIASAGTQRVAVASDNTPFTVKVSKDANANSVTNPIWTELTDGSAALGTALNPLVVTSEATAGTLVDSGQLTSSALAAGASANLDSANVGAGLTGKLLEATMSSSVRTKIDVYVLSTSTVLKRTFFVEANQSFVYSPADPDALQVVGAASSRNFRLTVTNMDASLAADVYGSITHVTV